MNVHPLQQELEAPIRSFRLYALERIIQEESSMEVLEILEKRKKIESDPECKILLDHAIMVVSSRQKGEEKFRDITPEDFLSLFSKATKKKKLLLLSRLTRKQLMALSPRFLELFIKEGDPSVNAAVLRAFKNNFPQERLKDIVPFLFFDNLSLRLAVLEILAHKAPKLLLRDLPKLLLHEDLRIRTLAIRGLAKIDIEEGLNHLSVLMEKGSPEAMIVALQSSFYFPFDRVKPLYLKFLALVQDPGLVDRIGVFLENNPDPEIPYRVWELLEASTGEKRKVLKKILRNACQTIEKSGMFGPEYSTYYENLKNWIQKRNLLRSIQELLSLFDSETVPLHEIEFQVVDKIDNPQFREGLETALEWPISKDCRTKVENWLQRRFSIFQTQFLLTDVFLESDEKPVLANIPSENGKPEVGKPAKTPNNIEQARAIASWKEKDLPAIRKNLDSVIRKKDSPKDLLNTAFRAAKRLRVKDYVEIARRKLAGKDSPLLQAVMEYLGEFDFDWFFPHLGNFLQSEHSRIRVSAIRILQKKDPAQSLSAIRAMLLSPNSTSRQTSLACLVFFEFATVREMLVDFIKTSDLPQHFAPALFYFRSNPEIENLFTLYQLEKDLENSGKGEKLDEIKRVQRENFEFLIKTEQLDEQSWGEFEEKLKKRMEEKEKAALEPKPYSVKVLNPRPNPSEESAIARIISFVSGFYKK